MQKRIILLFTIIVSVSTVIITVVTLILNSNYYHSKRLVKAIRAEDVSEVQRILKENPDCINTYPSITSKWWHSAMNWRVCYPLNEACCTDNVELIELLIANGADVNCNDGLTPLSITYSGKRDNWYAISIVLIESGASLDYTTEYSGGKSSVLRDIVTIRSGSSLSGYVPENNEEVVRAFNYALENCDHSSVDWMRVLQHSVSNDRIEIVKLLLDEGYCDVNDTSVGMTALMFAARDSTTEMVQLLLSYGADKNIKSSDGKTAYDYAVQYQRNDIIDILSN